DHGGGDGGGALVEGQEGARLAGHPPMLPGATPMGFGRESVRPGQASQTISSSDSSSRAMSSSMPVSSARISLAEARSPPKSPRSTGSKNSIAFEPSARYGRLASRKWTAGPVRPR